MYISNRHTLGAFESALQRLRDSVLTMASVTERNLNLAINGLFKRETESCERVIAEDEEIDGFEKQIDHDGIDIIVRFRPVASDLRSVIATMRLSGNLERVGDQAVSIARKALKLNERARLPELYMLEGMGREAMGMLKDSLRAFTDRDLDLAVSIKPRDKALDDINRQVSAKLVERMSEQSDSVDAFLNLIFISRHLERIGDYAKSIAADTVFAEAAQDIRHGMELRREL